MQQAIEAVVIGHWLELVGLMALMFISYRLLLILFEATDDYFNAISIRWRAYRYVRSTMRRLRRAGI